MEHAAEVHVEHPVPGGERALGEWGDGGDSGVRHERVKATELLDAERDKLSEIVGPRDVGSPRGGVSAAGRDLGDDPRHCVLAPSAQHDASPARGQQPRRVSVRLRASLRRAWR